MNADWQPLISIVIPIYNAGPYLEKCIDSVLRQTYRKLEIILVDDGSTDECPDICDAYAAADCRIVVIHKENGGQVSARNAGISYATGEYITFADADDWIDPQAYETILEKMTVKDTDMVLYGLVEEYEYGCTKKENMLAEGYYRKEEIEEKVYPHMLCGGHFFSFGVLPNLVCKLIRADLIKRVQSRVNEHIKMGEDADCTFQVLLEAENLQNLRYTPYHYRKRPDSMVGKPMELSQARNLYCDLKRAFAKCRKQEVMMSQLYQYMLFIMMLKNTDCFIGCEPFDRYFTAKRVVLYGAGGFGQAVYRVVTEKKIGKICLWLDQRYQSYQSRGLPVMGLEQLEDCDFDSIFIAILDTQMCRQIADSLVERGVREEQISYIQPGEKFQERIRLIMET